MVAIAVPRRAKRRRRMRLEAEVDERALREQAEMQDQKQAASYPEHAEEQRLSRGQCIAAGIVPRINDKHEDGGGCDDAQIECTKGEDGEQLMPLEESRALEESECFAEVRGLEEQEGHAHESGSAYPYDCREQTPEELGKRDMACASERGGHSGFQDEPYPVQRSPEEELPAAAVPDAAQEEGHEDREDPAHRAFPASSERNVDVIAEPRGDRDVPSVPELAHRASQVRLQETRGEPDSEEKRTARDDVHVCGIIRVDADV